MPSSSSAGAVSAGWVEPSVGVRIRSVAIPTSIWTMYHGALVRGGAYVGPGLRYAVDLADPGHAQFGLAGGQSGHSGSDHYDDGLRAWLAGSPQTLWMHESDVAYHRVGILGAASALESRPRKMIIFIHIPGFYAAVEQADNHELRGRPVVVGGDPRKRGSVTGVSVEARKRGVVEGMEAREALERCPEAVFRRTRLKRYRAVAAETRALLRATTDRIEEFGVDGTFLEVPPQIEALPLAAELCVHMQAELALHSVAGIGPTRFIAYLGARHPRSGGHPRGQA